MICFPFFFRKIELITSYGPFSEEESSDTEKVTVKTPKAKRKKTESKVSSPKPTMGPQLPPGGHNITMKLEKPKAITNSLVPYHPDNDDSDTDDTLDNTKLNSVLDNGGPPGAEPEKTSPLAQSPKSDTAGTDVEKVKADVEPETTDIRTVEVKDVNKEEDDDETTLLDRLKSQTQVLKELGGEIPEEVKIIITDTDKEPVKPEEVKESKNLKVKLSVKAKKLISASTTTAKARATDFIQTPDGLKPIQNKKEGTLFLISSINLTCYHVISLALLSK